MKLVALELVAKSVSGLQVVHIQLRTTERIGRDLIDLERPPETWGEAIVDGITTDSTRQAH